jgi:hypothetical protein
MGFMHGRLLSSCSCKYGSCENVLWQVAVRAVSRAVERPEPAKCQSVCGGVIALTTAGCQAALKRKISSDGWLESSPSCWRHSACVSSDLSYDARSDTVRSPDDVYRDDKDAMNIHEPGLCLEAHAWMRYEF